MLGIIALFLILIALLNLKRYGFLIWYGVIFVLSSLPFITIYQFISMAEAEVDSKGVIDIINHIFSKLNMYSMGFFIIGILSIAVAIILRIIDKQNAVE